MNVVNPYKGGGKNLFEKIHVNCLVVYFILLDNGRNHLTVESFDMRFDLHIMMWVIDVCFTGIEFKVVICSLHHLIIFVIKVQCLVFKIWYYVISLTQSQSTKAWSIIVVKFIVRDYFYICIYILRESITPTQKICSQCDMITLSVRYLAL